MLIGVLGNERDESKLQLSTFHRKSLTEESEILYIYGQENMATSSCIKRRWNWLVHMPRNDSDRSIKTPLDTRENTEESLDQILSSSHQLTD